MGAGVHHGWAPVRSRGRLTWPTGPAGESDGELGQARCRLTVTAHVMCAVLMLAATGQVSLPDEAWWAAGLFLIYAVLWSAWVAGAESRWRPWLAAVSDQALLGCTLWWSGPVHGGLLWGPLIISMGHGLRFGAARGMLAALTGGGVLLLLMHAAPSWQSARDWRWGMVLSAVLAPMYAVWLAQHLALARQSAHHQLQHLTHRAEHDHLTGLLNRDGLVQAFAVWAHTDGTCAQPMGLCYLDLDGFKGVNDALGHEAGDAVLVAVAQQLRAALRQGDPVARLGGDEFIVLLPQAGDRAWLATLADKLVRAVATAHDACGLTVPLGVSVGVCRMAPGVTLADGLRAADRLMYEAKHEGKNASRLGDLGPQGRGRPA